MYKLLFESKYFLLEHSSDRWYYFINITFSKIYLGLTICFKDIVLTPYVVIRTESPGIDIGFLFLNFGFFYTGKTNFIKIHFEEKNNIL